MLDGLRAMGKIDKYLVHLQTSATTLAFRKSDDAEGMLERNGVRELWVPSLGWFAQGDILKLHQGYLRVT